jgi:Tfp pilus assembly protein PilF
MSLLIKALESAEKGKQAELKKSGAGDAASADLKLEPLPNAQSANGAEAPGLNFAAAELAAKAVPFNAAAVAASVEKARPQPEPRLDSQHQLAANVFVANQAAKNSTSPLALLMLGVAGALTIWLGLQGYQYMNKLNAPELTLVRPSPQVTVAAPTTSPVATPVTAPQAGLEAPAAGMAAAPENTVPVPKPAVTAQGSAHDTAVIADDNAAAFKSAAASKAQTSKISSSRAAESANAPAEGEAASRKGASLKLVSRVPAAGVDPTLLAAYQAYSRGDDAAAQKQYRQVLQGDVRNVDALLGMAAIAVRQSRYADANGWYQKVLEIEPRNSTALSAIANSQITAESAVSATADNADTESRIKSMLAQQPEAANLHAALGNLYAAQNQWPLAQAAYFNASRYAPNSADYAFNLAVSLDQLGKAGLALVQYQRALGLLNNAGDALNSVGASNLDKAQLEARIQALQH